MNVSAPGLRNGRPPGSGSPATIPPASFRPASGAFSGFRPESRPTVLRRTGRSSAKRPAERVSRQKYNGTPCRPPTKMLLSHDKLTRVNPYPRIRPKSRPSRRGRTAATDTPGRTVGAAFLPDAARSPAGGPAMRAEAPKCAKALRMFADTRLNITFADADRLLSDTGAAGQTQQTNG